MRTLSLRCSRARAPLSLGGPSLRWTGFGWRLPGGGGGDFYGWVVEETEGDAGEEGLLGLVFVARKEFAGSRLGLWRFSFAW